MLSNALDVFCRPLESFVKRDDLVRVHVIDRSIHSPGSYVFGEIFNLAQNNLNVNKELVRHGLAQSAPTTLSSCDSEYFLLAQEQPEQQQSNARLALSRDRRSVPQHCSAPRSEIEQEECQHVVDDRHYNYMTILVSTVAIVAFVANFEAWWQCVLVENKPKCLLTFREVIVPRPLFYAFSLWMTSYRRIRLI